MSAPLSGDDMALELPDEEQVSTASPATSNVDYTQGFGSFWFNHYRPRVARKPVYASSEKKDSKFPFLKLPLEIRRMIYKYLVDEVDKARPARPSIDDDDYSHADWPFWVTVKEADNYRDNDERQRPVPPLFILEAPDQRNRQHFNNGVDTGILDVHGVYRSIADPSFPQTAGTPTAAQQPELYSEIRSTASYAESDEAEFSDADDSDASSWCSDEAEVTMHPRWREDARMKASSGNLRDLTTLRVTTAIVVGSDDLPTKRSDKTKRRRVRAAIRNLSLTSAQIAYELGQVLWAGAAVFIESPECFLAFARDRPAALPLIHCVVLRLDKDDVDCDDWRFEDKILSLVTMMRILSEHCRIRVLSLTCPPNFFRSIIPHSVRGQNRGGEFPNALDHLKRLEQVVKEHPGAYEVLDLSEGLHFF